MKSWKEWATAFILSIIWYGAGVVQSLSHIGRPHEENLFGKIIMFPFEVPYWIFKSAPNLAKSNILKFIPLFVSIFLTTILIVAIYEILKALKESNMYSDLYRREVK